MLIMYLSTRLFSSMESVVSGRSMPYMTLSDVKKRPLPFMKLMINQTASTSSRLFAWPLSVSRSFTSRAFISHPP